MPRIRKKTSNRTKLHDRAKKHKQIKESMRKKKRDAKKNPQWKSKTPKDPGIPNDFPYKDQILAEVAEQRRVAAEEKKLKKEQKKAARAAVDPSGSASEAEDEPEVEVEDLLPKGLNVGADAIASLSAKLVRGDIQNRPKAAEPAPSDDEDEVEVPVLINHDLPHFKSVLDKADVIVEVLDTRDPLSFRSAHVEELAKGKKKKVVFVLNKIDTCPREAVSSWLTYLCQTQPQSPTFLFRSSTAFLPTQPITPTKKTKGKGKASPVNDAIGVEGILSCLGEFAKKKRSKGPLNVAVVGVTNAGKSSFINSLLGQPALEVYTLASSSRGPTTTVLPQEVTLEISGKTVCFIDTPGLTWVLTEEDAEVDEGAETRDQIRARDILLRAKGRIDRLKDPLPPIERIIARASVEDLMLLYSLPTFAKGEVEALLISIARSQQLIKKKGRLDTVGAARIILRDWSVGKFARWCMPPTLPEVPATRSATKTAAKTKEEVWDKANDEVLAGLPTRKEMRKAGVGLVKFTPGTLEVRKVPVEELWEAEEESSDEEGEAEEGAMEIDGEEGSDEEEGDEEEVDEEVEEEEQTPPPPPTSNKQKRKRGADAAPAPPSKKVAFALELKGTKQARKAGSKPKATDKESAASAEPEPVNVAKVKSTVSKAPTTKKGKEKASKVANVSSKKKVSPGDGEAYDFGKFF